MRTYKAFTEPTPYEIEKQRAERQRRYAELLQQQAMAPEEEPYTFQGFRAMPSPANALSRVLQAYAAKKVGEKAEQAEARAREADVKSAIEEMQRINKPPEAVEFGDIPFMRPEDQERVKALTGQTSVTGPEFNISPTGEVTGFQPMQMGEVPDLQPYLPTMTADQKRLAYAKMLGGGTVSQLLGTQGLAGLEKSAGEMPYAKIDLLGADPESIRAFEASGRTDFSLVRRRDDPSKPFFTPKDIADLRLKQASENVARAKVLSDLPANQQSMVPSIPSIESLLNTPENLRPYMTPGGMTRGADLETGEFTPERGLQYRGQATTATGAPVSGEQKPVIERVSPKDYGTLVAKQPTDKRAAQTALGQISMMRNFIQDLQQHGGTDYIFGPIASITPDIRGSATSARSLFDTLRERSSVEALKQSRAEGFAPGSITEQEWPRFETAIGAIRGAKDPRAMRVALENANAQLQDIERRILGNYQGTYGSKFPLEWSPAPYKPESSLYPTPKAKSEDQAVFDEADRLILEMQRRRAPRGK